MKILLIISLLFGILDEHDIHLSVTEVKSEGEGIEVVSKIFLDDLQMSMGLVPGEELPDDYVGADELIQRFINKNLVIRLNDEIVELTLFQTEAALPAIWATFKAEKVEWQSQNILIVENFIMTDLFKDQKNIFKINLNGLEDQYVFSSDDTRETFKF